MLPMIVTALVLAAVLAALAIYIRRGHAQIAMLRRTDDPAVRRRFFASKVLRQGLKMVALPMVALVLTGNLARAFHPGAEIAGLSAFASEWTGFSAADLHDALLLTPWLVLELGVLIVLLEALPLLLRSRKVIAAGNFAVLRPRNMPELGWALVMALFAGVGEELLFRGFLPFALADLGVPMMLAFLLPVGLFGLCHVYQGVIGVAATTAAGVLLTAIYLISGSLLVAIAVHAVIDIIGLVIRPAVGMAIAWVLRRPA